MLTARKVDPKTDPITGKVTEEKQLIIYEYRLVEDETPADPPKPTKTTKTTKTGSVKTGDSANTAAYAGAMGLALAALAVLASGKRKKSR